MSLIMILKHYTLYRLLLTAVHACLSTYGVILVTFAHRGSSSIHTQHTIENDLEFFVIAERDFDMSVKQINSRQMRDCVSGGSCAQDGTVTVYLYEMCRKCDMS
jgi:hypothetical protein